MQWGWGTRVNTKSCIIAVRCYRWMQIIHSEFDVSKNNIYLRLRNKSCYIFEKRRRIRPSYSLYRAMATTIHEQQSAVEEEFVRVNGVKTHVLKLGHFKDDLPETGRRVMMLIIPGNPGVPHFYEDFMQELYHRAGGQVPVWTLGHARHVRPPGETLSITDVCSAQINVCGLDAQIAHKVQLIQENIPANVSLILVGHSIGCYMILNMLDHLTDHTVLRCFMLFPTVERMAVSPNGKRLTPVLCRLRWLAVLLVLFFSILPRNFRHKLIQWWYRDADCPNCMSWAILETLTPWTVNYMTFLAKIEMKSVTELQRDLVKKHMDKLSFYYGSSDHWVPVQYYYDLINEFPKIDARLCDSGLKHAFVVETQGGQDMARIVWLWVQLRCHNELSYLGDNSSERDSAKSCLD